VALDFAHGAIRWLAASTATTVYTVSGLSFQPKAIRFYWVGIDSAATDTASAALDGRRGVGFATSTSNRCAAATFSDDAALTSACASVVANDCCVCTVSAAAARDGELDLNSITSDGFTLIVDDQGVADITVFWEAWGGSDITVQTCGTITEPASATTLATTVTGFTTSGTDQVVMLAGVQSTAAVNTAQAESSGLYIGYATGTSSANQIVVTGALDHSSAAMDADGFCQTGKCATHIVLAGGNATMSASLTSWDTDGFTLTYAGTVVSARKSVYLAIKGGKWSAGAYTIAGNSLNATATVTNLPFLPSGISLIGRMTAEQSGTTSSAQDRIGMGTGSSTSSRRSLGYLDEDATASSACEVNLVAEYDSVLCFPSDAGALLASYDISAIVEGGFTIIVDTAGGVASEWQGYLAYGNVPTQYPCDLTMAPLVPIPRRR
jgi:hypothetical protein